MITMNINWWGKAAGFIKAEVEVEPLKTANREERK
jgi:hypothetical protein